MSLPIPDTFSDYLVFVDEGGDHGLSAVNRDFPLFALAFCVFPKSAYVDEVTPALRRLKVATFGHDLVVLHEHDIRKKAVAFAMMSREPREAFLDALSRVIEAAPFTLVAVVIDKRGLRLDDVESANRIIWRCSSGWNECSGCWRSAGKPNGSRISSSRRAANARTRNSNWSSAGFARAAMVCTTRCRSGW